MPPGQSGRSLKPTGRRSGPTEVNPELAAIIRTESNLKREAPLSEHIKSIEARKAKELAAFLRVAVARLRSDALF